MCELGGYVKLFNNYKKNKEGRRKTDGPWLISVHPQPQTIWQEPQLPYSKAWENIQDFKTFWDATGAKE